MNAPRTFGIFAGALALLSVSTTGLAPNVADLGKAKFNQYKSALPSNFDVVAAGGYDAVYKMSVDPKAELVSIVSAGLKDTDGSISDGAAKSDKLEALIDLLEAQGKGFQVDLVDGDWSAVLSKQGKKSAQLQKIVDKKGKAQKASSNFSVKEMKFYNENSTPRGNGKLEAVVKYDTSTDAFSKTADGKIILRRISCDIVGASFKYKWLPKIPLPLRRKGGYLHFAYLDHEMRVTRGNRGGVFVHFRPEFLEKALA